MFACLLDIGDCFWSSLLTANYVSVGDSWSCMLKSGFQIKTKSQNRHN